MLGVDLFEYRRWLVDQKLILEEELDVLPTGEGAPMRPRAVDEVEEGDVWNAIQILSVHQNVYERRDLALTLGPARTAH